MITRYTDEQKRNLVLKFIKYFNKDKRSFVDKLKSIQMAKGTYSGILNGGSPSKKSMEGMRAFIEKRTPKFMLVGEEQFYCFCCENIVDNAHKSDDWTCRQCQYEVTRNHREQNREHHRVLKRRWREVNAVRENEVRRAKRNFNNYGKFARAVRVIKFIKKEVLHEKIQQKTAYQNIQFREVHPGRLRKRFMGNPEQSQRAQDQGSGSKLCY